MRRRSRRSSPSSKRSRADNSPNSYCDESSASSTRDFNTNVRIVKTTKSGVRHSKLQGNYERDIETDFSKKHECHPTRYVEFGGEPYHLHRGDEFSDLRMRSVIRPSQSSRAFTTQDRSVPRIDPVFAAAAAAALNASLGTSTNVDLASLALRTSGSSNPTVAAVAAAAMNAAAIAAALSGASPALSAAGLSTLTRPLRNFASNSVRSHYIDRDASLRSEKAERRDAISSSGKIFPHHLDHRDPEDDPNSTRTLFIGNLAPDITEAEITEIFEKYGFIEDIDIKRPAPGSGCNAYAFLRFVNLDMAHRAKVDMSGHMIGQFTCKIGYGKVTPTRCLWVGGLGPWITYPTFASLLNRFGPPERIIWPSGKNYAHVLFRNVELSTVAAATLRGYPLGGPDRRIRVDFTDEIYMTNDPLVARRRPLPSTIENDDILRKTQRSHFRGGDCSDEIYRANFPNHSRHQDRDRHKRKPTPDRLLRASRSRSLSHSSKSSINTSSSKIHDLGSRRNVSPRCDHSSRSNSPDYRSPYDKQNSLARRPLDAKLEAKTCFRHNPSLGSSDFDPLLSLETALNVEQLATSLPTAWDGMFFLKNSSFACRMHILRGDENLVDQFLPRRHLSTFPPCTVMLSRVSQKEDPAMHVETHVTEHKLIATSNSNSCDCLKGAAAGSHSDYTPTEDNDRLTRGGRPRTPPEEDETVAADVRVKSKDMLSTDIEREEGEEDDEDEDDDEEHTNHLRPAVSKKPEDSPSTHLGGVPRSKPPVTSDDSDFIEEPICLRITQRMKLDPVKLEDVSQRIRSAGNAGFCVLLAMPATTKQVSSNLADLQDPLKQNQRPLRNLISYLRTKDSAGVVLLNPLTQEIRHDPASGKLNNPEEAAPDPAVTGVLHAFPPCDFSFDLLAQRATRLQKEYAKDNHLVILLIRSCGSL